MYVPLKITTDYSLLKSMIKIDDLINTLKLRNITSCALCDEYLYGVINFIFIYMLKIMQVIKIF